MNDGIFILHHIIYVICSLKLSELSFGIFHSFPSKHKALSRCWVSIVDRPKHRDNVSCLLGLASNDEKY